MFRKWASIHHVHPTLHLEAVRPALLASLKAFMARPWFTRRWVIQEVSLAHTATAHYGPHCIAWGRFCHAIETIACFYDIDCSFYSRKDADVSSCRECPFGNGIPSPPSNRKCNDFQPFWDHHSSLCTDERNRLFALYGMSNDFISRTRGHRLSVQCPIDYSVDFDLIYTQLATAAIESGLSDHPRSYPCIWRPCAAKPELAILGTGLEQD
jgi:hypothetical protein